jgi:AcrR family transcriptional regulator
MDVPVPTTKSRRGRPPAFDRARALQAAMMLFWERGYEGTSFDDLIATMAISPSSFYNAFGSKQGLYEAAVERYLTLNACWFGRVLQEQTDTRTAFERLIAAAAQEFTRCDLPAGCMISLEGTHLPPALAPVRDSLVAQRALSGEALAARIRRGMDEGDVPGDTDPAALAAFFGAVLRGMSVQARDGASAARLAGIGRLAMRAWPTPPCG